MFLDTILIKLFFTSNKCIIKWSNISEHKKKTERGVVTRQFIIKIMLNVCHNTVVVY